MPTSMLGRSKIAFRTTTGTGYRPESSFKIIAFQSTNHPFMIGASKADCQVSFVAACLMEVLKN